MANTSEKYTFFFGAASPFSQHHISEFEVDGKTYSCAEQYMMHQKAVLFNDDEYAEKIMLAEKPGQMKALGRKVRNFDEGIWSSNCEDVVKKGNIAKFSQSPELKEKLMETSGTILVEASPFDRKWGIGLSAKNPKAQCKTTWRGKNLLGYILTEIRDIYFDNKRDT